MDKRPIMAVTMGDPAGIGAEIIVKTLANPKFYRIARPVVVGDARVMKKSLRFVREPLEINRINDLSDALFKPGIIDIVHVPNDNVEKIEYGKISKEAGQCAVSYIFRAIEMALNREVDGVVTGPINKASMHLAGYKQYAGHTEIFADRTNTKDYAMLLAVDDLYVLHVSTHVSLAEACRRVKKERVSKVIELAHDFIETYDIPNKTIGIAALNPHAGEGGAFGREEIEEILPAIEEARSKGWDVTDPLPPDTVFVRAKRGQFQVIVVMYHDQGHIPVKVINFDSGVNVTVGIPIIRTSVDHGTAFGKADKGTASSASMEAALALGARMAAAKFYR
jgi:4-hydroxythreonine-4-phosphate dehydrogenase